MDARSLLRDHKAASSTASINTSLSRPAPSQAGSLPQHATMTAGGTLKCTLCQLAGIKHWESHSASKQHRQALTRFKKIEDTVARKGAADVDDRGGKRRRLDDVASVDVSPSVEMTTTADDENIDEPPASAPSAPAPAIDAELDSFLSSIAADITAPNTTEEKTASAAPPRQKMYKPSQPETQVSYEAAPIRNLPANTQATGGDDGKEEEEETEGDRRRREEKEEKEEIMDRLMDEQRAQEDADQRVTSLKAKLELVKRRRAEMMEKKEKGENVK